MSAEDFQKLIQRRLPKPSNKRPYIQTCDTVNSRLPKLLPKLKSAVTSLNLLDEPDYEKRVKIFVGYCVYSNYTVNTTKRYFNILKRHGLFGDVANLKPNSLKFLDKGRPHQRIISRKDFERLVGYLIKNFSPYTAPILVAVFTGLRSFELLQFTTDTLYQLKKQQPSVPIKRKQTNIQLPRPTLNTEYDSEGNPICTTTRREPLYWKPVYNTELMIFIDKLIDLYKIEYKTYLDKKINTRLFMITPKTLGNRIKSIYNRATNKLAPHGFGIHSCRNLVSMLLAEQTDNIIVIRDFLQHKNIKTTRGYIKADRTFTVTEFNRLTNYEFSNVRKQLEV
jgi:integrase